MHKHLRLTCYALLCLLVPIGVMAQTEHTLSLIHICVYKSIKKVTN